jgi:hypothetical protein
VEKQGIKRVCGRKDSPPEYGMIVIIIDQALTYFYPYSLKVFCKRDHPNALKEERGVKTKRPLQNIFRYQHDG